MRRRQSAKRESVKNTTACLFHSDSECTCIKAVLTQDKLIERLKAAINFDGVAPAHWKEDAATVEGYKRRLAEIEEMYG